MFSNSLRRLLCTLSLPLTSALAGTPCPAKFALKNESSMVLYQFSSGTETLILSKVLFPKFKYTQPILAPWSLLAPQDRALESFFHTFIELRFMLADPKSQGVFETILLFDEKYNYRPIFADATFQPFNSDAVSIDLSSEPDEYAFLASEILDFIDGHDLPIHPYIIDWLSDETEADSPRLPNDPLH